MDKQLWSLEKSAYKKEIFDKAWRFVDILGSIVAILISLPLFTVIFFLIKIEDTSSPAIFKQIRVGKDGTPFVMYKFRSMIVNAEKELASLKNKNEMDGLMFKIEDDPRITKVGKWLRKYSLDEFPQFINILKGDMSFVGPRPPIMSEYLEYNSYHMQRLLVKPGCTGLWQVSGRNALKFEEMIALDLEYIQNRSVLLNIKILLLTFKEFTNKGSGI
ncbi:TPA: sugar transferase [Enterococcus faecalis]